MLKLAALYDGVQQLAADAAGQAADRARRRAATLTAFQRHAAAPEAWRQTAVAARTSWLVADFEADPAQVVDPPPAPEEAVVLAADGSQIYPDRHGATACYVINLGLVTLRYGPEAAAKLDSEPLLFADELDLYLGEAGERRAIGPDEVSIQRAVLELEALLELARPFADEPAVALVDGTLIPWMMVREGDPWRQAMRLRYLDALAGFEALGVPVAGYISRTGSSDVVNLVRIGECDQPQVNCDRCPHLAAVTAGLPRGRVLTLAQADRLPCGAPVGLADADLCGDLLRPGKRSAVFVTRSKAFAEREEHRVRFCYLHTGGEVARVELPPWVAADEALLARVHAVLCDQVGKGHGYPVALQEAHEQAVVRAPDRAAFERLLERVLVQRGSVVRFSEKSRSKQRPGV